MVSSDSRPEAVEAVPDLFWVEVVITLETVASVLETVSMVLEIRAVALESAVVLVSGSGIVVVSQGSGYDWRRSQPVSGIGSEGNMLIARLKGGT